MPKNIFTNKIVQCNNNGSQYLLLDSIIYHKKDNIVIRHGDQFSKLKFKQNFKKTAKGWYICVLWKYGRNN